MKPFIVREPCPNCPFSRKVEPGKLGGSSPYTYIGQINGPFYLPCHMHTDYTDPQWKTDLEKPQCAGAAIFRANLSIDKRMPPFLLSLPANTELVFATYEEFLVHHSSFTRLALTPDECTEYEMQRVKCTMVSHV